MFIIGKTFKNNTGKKVSVFMTNGHSEILEIPKVETALALAEVMNENSDSNCLYEVIDGSGDIIKNTK